MKKAEELRNPKSCLSKAQSGEMIFVLRANDLLFAQTVRHWAAMADGVHEEEKIAEALRCADAGEQWRDARPQAPEIVTTILTGPAVPKRADDIES